ncbi:MAG TPA: farnesyl diphosphate synthase [Rhodanobacteraceae bacterium]|nr:farnesyl diphosphate synthase [Rhodanobacteraceae bacterium]
MLEQPAGSVSEPRPPAPLRALAERIDAVLDRALPLAGSEPDVLVRAMRHAALGGGKRVRPLLVYAAGTALGAPLEWLDGPACAVELVHAYSLVHDDLPAMDNDVLRRGQPTCHILFGEAIAILAGDALHALAFEILTGAGAARLAPAVRMEMARVLAHACGIRGMAGGQVIDLASTGARLTPTELEHMHAAKTGALIRASVRMGALAAGCSDAELFTALDQYGRAIGLAFQVRDDILDVEGETRTLGKTAGKDSAAAKPTYPSTIGLDASRRHLGKLIARAQHALAPLGERAGLLHDLAHYIVERHR